MVKTTNQKKMKVIGISFWCSPPSKRGFFLRCREVVLVQET
jgi:hypothetical protein